MPEESLIGGRELVESRVQLDEPLVVVGENALDGREEIVEANGACVAEQSDLHETKNAWIQA